MPHLYLDHNATTPLAPEVLEAMLPYWTQHHGNPSSVHRLGRAARVGLEQSREALASTLGGSPSEIVFTGSGSEANTLALHGALPFQPAGGRHRVLCSAVEHPSVLESAAALGLRGYAVERLPVDSLGRVDLDAARAALRPEVALLSVMLASNEVGTVQPVAELAGLAHEAGALVHCDAVQGLGKMPLDVRRLGVDLLTVSAHKIYGPKGIGALWVREPLELRPLIHGGPQEDRRRAGTENLASIVGFAQACRLFTQDLEAETARIRGLRDALADRLSKSIPDLRLHGDRQNGLPNTLSLALPRIAGDELLILLDLKGICVATGSACSSGSLRPSHVLLALGLTETEARRVIRLSLGRDTTPEELDRVAGLLENLAAKS